MTVTDMNWSSACCVSTCVLPEDLSSTNPSSLFEILRKHTIFNFALHHPSFAEGWFTRLSFRICDTVNLLNITDKIFHTTNTLHAISEVKSNFDFPVTSINARDICAHSFDIPMGKCNRKIVMSCESSLSHDVLRLYGCEFNIDLHVSATHELTKSRQHRNSVFAVL